MSMEHLTQSRKDAKRRRGEEAKKKIRGKEVSLSPLLFFAALRLCVK
jgi:hypothetical protein